VIGRTPVIEFTRVQEVAAIAGPGDRRMCRCRKRLGIMCKFLIIDTPGGDVILIADNASDTDNQDTAAVNILLQGTAGSYTTAETVIVTDSLVWVDSPRLHHR